MGTTLSLLTSPSRLPFCTITGPLVTSGYSKVPDLSQAALPGMRTQMLSAILWSKRPPGDRRWPPAVPFSKEACVVPARERGVRWGPFPQVEPLGSSRVPAGASKRCVTQFGSTLGLEI